MTRAWMLVALLWGCSGPPAPMAPPPELVEAVIADEPIVPPPPVEPSPVGMAVESFLDLAAADAEAPRSKVEMLTATWCVNCPRSKQVVVPWLEAMGYTVEIVDVSDCDADELRRRHQVNKIPAYKFTRGNDSIRIEGPRYEQKTGKPYAPDFKDAFALCPPPPKDNAPAVAMSVPAISVGDFTDRIAGMDEDLFGVVHVTVPKDVSWTVTKKPASVLLTFKEGKQPSLKSLKYVRANPSLVSVEISPFWMEFHTDSWWPMLRTVRVDFDWSPPQPVKKTSAVQTRGRYYAPRPQYRPVPQKPRQVVEEPTPAPPEPIKLGKGCPVIVPVAHTWRACVSLWVKRDRTVYSILGVPSIQEGKGCGSGMIVSPQGHILTCNHVIDGVKSIEAEFCDGQKRPCKVVETDKKTDLAILKVAGVDLPAVTWAADVPMVGADAYMVGNPYGRGESVARGVVAGLHRDLEADDIEYKGMLQIAVAINPGNSGGAVVNSKGDLIGMVAAMYGDGEGIMFCIPVETAKPFVDRVVKPSVVGCEFTGKNVEPYKFQNDGADGILLSFVVRCTACPPPANCLYTVVTLPDSVSGSWKAVGASAFVNSERVILTVPATFPNSGPVHIGIDDPPVGREIALAIRLRPIGKDVSREDAMSILGSDAGMCITMGNGQ